MAAKKKKRQTARRGKSRELDAANDDLMNLLASTDLFVVFLDAKLCIRRMTRAMLKLFQLVDEGVGRPLRDFAPRFIDDTLWDDTQRVLENPASLEREVATNDGDWYLRRINPYRTADGRLEGVVIVFVDITERKRAEAKILQLTKNLEEGEGRLRAIVETAADAIITIAERGKIHSFNTAARRIFGYTAEEAIGQNVKILMPSPFREEHDGYIARYLKSGTPRIIGIGREVIAQRKDGSVFPIDLAVSQHHDGTQWFFTGIIRDISDRKTLQQELLTIASNEQRRIGQDLHDGVGQELTGLGLLAASLAKNLDEHSAKDAQAARRLSDGIEAVQSQVGALAKGLVPVEVDAEGLMAALTELAEQARRDSGVDCSFRCKKAVRVENNEIATHLYRIAQEATANSLKHGRPKHIVISLDADDGRISLAIRDDGVGIAAPARRVAGMGLRIMQYRAGLIGGTLSVDIGPQGGALVTCVLVLNRSHDKSEAI